MDVFRNLIPPIESEMQFFSLIKGLYFFTLVYYQDKKYNFRNSESPDLSCCDFLVDGGSGVYLTKDKNSRLD